MKKEQFRIGNLIHDREDRICRVKTLGEEIEAWPIKGGGMVGLPFKPIPLTQEWLKKFGKPESEMNLSFIIGDFKIWVDKSQNNWYFVWKKQYIKIDYVHQLQNLFFALTGVELTIEE